MDKFKGLDKRASAGGSDEGVNSTHQNTITQITVHTASASRDVAKFSTTAVDGRLVIWDVRSLEASIAGLSIR